MYLKNLRLSCNLYLYHYFKPHLPHPVKFIFLKIKKRRTYVSRRLMNTTQSVDLILVHVRSHEKLLIITSLKIERPNGTQLISQGNAPTRKNNFTWTNIIDNRSKNRCSRSPYFSHSNFTLNRQRKKRRKKIRKKEKKGGEKKKKRMYIVHLILCIYLLLLFTIILSCTPWSRFVILIGGGGGCTPGCFLRCSIMGDLCVKLWPQMSQT